MLHVKQTKDCTIAAMLQRREESFEMTSDRKETKNYQKLAKK